MRTVGRATTAVGVAVAVLAAAVGVRSISDIRRYFKIRSM